jgi:hypothetical protein
MSKQPLPYPPGVEAPPAINSQEYYNDLFLDSFMEADKFGPYSLFFACFGAKNNAEETRKLESAIMRCLHSPDAITKDREKMGWIATDLRVAAEESGNRKLQIFLNQQFTLLQESLVAERYSSEDSYSSDGGDDDLTIPAAQMQALSELLKTNRVSQVEAKEPMADAAGDSTERGNVRKPNLNPAPTASSQQRVRKLLASDRQVQVTIV